MGAIKRTLEELTLKWVNKMRIIEQAFTCPEDYVDGWKKLKSHGRSEEERIRDYFLKGKKPKKDDYVAQQAAAGIQTKLEGTNDFKTEHKDRD